jgi:hypothetical protein
MVNIVLSGCDRERSDFAYPVSRILNRSAVKPQHGTCQALTYYAWKTSLHLRIDDRIEISRSSLPRKLARNSRPRTNANPWLESHGDETCRTSSFNTAQTPPMIA